MEYPVLAGYKLTSEEHLLVDYLLSPLLSSGLKVLESPYLSDLSSGIAYYPDLSENSLREITDWMHPVLVFAGKDAQNEQKDFQIFYENGIGCVYLCPKINHLIIPPDLKLPEVKQHAYVISDIPNHRKLFRQILRSGGYNVRSDFQSNEGLETELKRITESQKDLWPELIIVDLDSDRIDIPSLFYFIRNLFQKHPPLKAKTSVLAMKDFAKPGLHLGTIASSLKPLTKKIFHPHEALLALCEAVAAPPRSVKSDGFRLKSFRSLEEILYGSAGNFSDPEQLRIMENFLNQSEYFGKFSLFTWLFQYLLSEGVSSGVVLSPEPAVDPRNFLNGIRRP